MKITRLWVDEFHLFKNFTIDFDTESSVHFILGQNGSGKSTVLEIILRILGGVKSETIARAQKFDFELDFISGEISYTFARQNDKYHLFDQTHGETIVLSSSWKKFSQSFQGFRGFEDGGPSLRLMPKRVITLYTGSNPFVHDINRTLYRQYKKNANTTLQFTRGYDIPAGTYISYGERDERNFPEHQFIDNTEDSEVVALCSIFWSKDSEQLRNILKKNIHINSVDKLLVELTVNSIKGPSQFLKAFDLVEPRLRGKRYFKNIRELRNKVAHGQQVDNEDLALAKIKLTLEVFQMQLEYIDQDISRYIDPETINYDGESTITFSITFDRRMLDATRGMTRIGIFNFLEKLQTLFKARYRAAFNGELSTDRMSDGEKQLLRLTGLLSLTQNESNIILLDEPDTHMNPRWKYRLESIIEQVAPNGQNQIIITTHDPLMINGVKKERVRLLEKTAGNISVSQPQTDTIGMGVDGMLTSEYYGLETSYDKKTAGEYQERLALFRKVLAGDATENDKNKLVKLTKYLDLLPAMNHSIDYLYNDFIQEYKKTPYFGKDYLSPKKINAEKQKIKEIIEDLYQRRGKNEIY